MLMPSKTTRQATLLPSNLPITVEKHLPKMSLSYNLLVYHCTAPVIALIDHFFMSFSCLAFAL